MNLLLEIPDPIFGSIKIVNPKILRIVQTPLFERLKGIKQAGIDTACGARESCSRYEHSLGTYELVRRLQPDDESEQIFALLHDIYHTNFSHTIDFMTDRSDISFHEANKKQFFENIGENPLIEILGSEWMSYMLHSENHPITKNNGADKIDYLLRDGYYMNLIDKPFIDEILNNLCVFGNRIVCKSETIIKKFHYYSKQMTSYYNGAQSKGLAIIFCTLLKIAVSKNYISLTDLYYKFRSDEEIWNILIAIPDDDIKHLLKYLNGDTVFKLFPADVCHLRGYQLLRNNVPNRLRHIHIPLLLYYSEINWTMVDITEKKNHISNQDSKCDIYIKIVPVL